jgi:hypothetical protein
VLYNLRAQPGSASAQLARLGFVTPAGWLDSIGVWPLLAAPAVLVLGGMLLGKAHHRRLTLTALADDRPAPSTDADAAHDAAGVRAYCALP